LLLVILILLSLSLSLNRTCCWIPHHYLEWWPIKIPYRWTSKKPPKVSLIIIIFIVIIITTIIIILRISHQCWCSRGKEKR
jgi:hypothetical protein